MGFNTSVLVNNLLALKAFRTFLNNYKQHELPRGVRANALVRWAERRLVGFLIKSIPMVSRQRLLLDVAKGLVELKATSVMTELVQDRDAQTAFASLKDAPVGMFSILYLVQNSHLLAEIKSAKELFDLISETELKVALLKNPREEQSYK